MRSSTEKPKDSPVLAQWSQVTKGWENNPEQRIIVGRLLTDEIRQGCSARSKRHDRWNQCENLYYSRPPDRGYEPYPNAANSHIPIVQPKVDTLGSLVVGTITSQEPFCNAVPYGETGQEILERKEQIVYAFLKDAGILEALDKVSPIAGVTNAGHVFQYWKDDKICLEVSRSQEVVVWPVANIDNTVDAKLVMRQKWLRRSQVEANRSRKEDKWWSDVPINDTADPQADVWGKDSKEYTNGKLQTLNEDWEGNQKLANPASRKDDFLVELYEGVFSAPGEDGEEVKFWGVLDFKAQALQFAYPYDETVADKFGYKPETGFGYWPRTSVADNLQEIQLYANEILSLVIDGVRMSIFGTVFGQFNGASADMRTAPGQVVSDVVLEPGGVMMPQPNLSMALPVLQWLIQYADQIGHISVESTGGQAKTNATATEVQARQSGQGASVESYIRCFGKGVKSLFARAERLIVKNFNEAMESKVGQMLKLEAKDLPILLTPCSWELATSTPSATPMAQASFIQGSLVPMMQVPGNGLDSYNLTKAILERGERMGVLDASDLQTSKDPSQQIVGLAQTLGIDPQMLMQAVSQLEQTKQTGQQNGQTDMGGQMAGGIGAFGEAQGPAQDEAGASGLLTGLGTPGATDNGMFGGGGVPS